MPPHLVSYDETFGREDDYVEISPDVRAPALTTPNISARLVLHPEQRELESYYRDNRAYRYRHDQDTRWIIDNIDRSICALTKDAFALRRRLYKIRYDIELGGLVQMTVFHGILETWNDLIPELHTLRESLDDNETYFRRRPRIHKIKEFDWMDQRVIYARVLLFWCVDEHVTLREHIKHHDLMIRDLY